MSAKPRVLCVDDEEALLDGLRLQLRKQFKVTTATSGQAGLDRFDEALATPDEAFAAVVSDMRMPHMNGATFLTEVMKRSPSTPRILLSGQADLDSTIAAINDAKIFRFLTKPCEAGLLAETLYEAMEVARLREAERVLLDQTLRGTVTMLTEVLGLVSAAAYGRTSRLRDIVDQLCSSLGIEPSWDLDVGTLLSQIGSVVVPEALDAEADVGERHATIAANLLANIPRLEGAAEIVRSQHREAALVTDELARVDDADRDAELLRVAVAYDKLLAQGKSRTRVIDELGSVGKPPPRWCLDALRTVTSTADDMIEAAVDPSDLVPGMELLDDLNTSAGTKLAGERTVLTAVLIERINSFAASTGIDTQIAVLAPRRAVSTLKVR